jgi:hypothetical protein
MSILALYALCCCFDADSTVWRRRTRDDHSVAVEQICVSDIAIGDSLLSMNPFTRQTYWEPVIAKAHYSYFDGGYQLSPMRTLWLERNISHITLSHTHFIYVYAKAHQDQDDIVNNEMYLLSEEPQLLLARDVQVGDYVLYYNVTQLHLTSSNSSSNSNYNLQGTPVKVSHIDQLITT